MQQARKKNNNLCIYYIYILIKTKTIKGKQLINVFIMFGPN